MNGDLSEFFRRPRPLFSIPDPGRCGQTISLDQAKAPLIMEVCDPRAAALRTNTYIIMYSLST